jgi:hypothetical protein
VPARLDSAHDFIARSVDDAPLNPWLKQHWNLTRQVQIYKRDQAEADHLAQLAGHQDAPTAREGPLLSPSIEYGARRISRELT